MPSPIGIGFHSILVFLHALPSLDVNASSLCRCSRFKHLAHVKVRLFLESGRGLSEGRVVKENGKASKLDELVSNARRR